MDTDQISYREAVKLLVAYEKRFESIPRGVLRAATLPSSVGLSPLAIAARQALEDGRRIADWMQVLLAAAPSAPAIAELANVSPYEPSTFAPSPNRKEH